MFFNWPTVTSAPVSVKLRRVVITRRAWRPTPKLEPVRMQRFTSPPGDPNCPDAILCRATAFTDYPTSSCTRSHRSEPEPARPEGTISYFSQGPRYWLKPAEELSK